MGDQLRLFIGVRVSMTTIRALEAVLPRLRDTAKNSGINVRWVAPATYHITLKFLGWSRPDAVEAIRDAVGEAITKLGTKRFRLDCAGGGAFPSTEEARVLWAGVSDPDGHLAEIATAIDNATVRLGYRADGRAFHPHVTLGRVQELANASQLLVSLTEQNFSETWVDEVTLLESTIKPNGSEYTQLVHWPLEDGSKSRSRHTGAIEPSLGKQESRQGDTDGPAEQRPHRAAHSSD